MSYKRGFLWAIFCLLISHLSVAFANLGGADEGLRVTINMNGTIVGEACDIETTAQEVKFNPVQLKQLT